MSDENHPFGFSLDEMDTESFFNMRDWLKMACEAQGARMTGGGIGMGQADIDIELEGCFYNISIRPLRHPSNSNNAIPQAVAGGGVCGHGVPLTVHCLQCAQDMPADPTADGQSSNE